MPDRRNSSSHRPRRSGRTAGERGPRRSDLSSGGGQVRQSNRSGLSRKSRHGDPSRQTDAPATQPPSPAEPAAPAADEKSPPTGDQARSQRK